MADDFTLPSDEPQPFALPSESGVAPAQVPATLGQSALDAAKQLPTGVAVGLESIPKIVPSALRGIGHGIEWGLNKLGLEPDSMAEKSRQQDAIADAAHPWSIADALPEPKTTAGQYARTIGEFAPAAAVGPGGLARRIATQDVVPAVASETAGQATAGTAAEPYARVGAAVLGGFPFGRWRTATTSPTPLIDDLHDAAGDAYRQIRESGFALKPKPVATLADQIEQELTSRGWTERNVPETYGVIRDLQDLHNAPASSTVTAGNFDTARQELLQAARNQANKREGGAAWTAIGKLDDYLSNVPQGHVAAGDAQTASALFDEARGNWAAMKRLEMANGKVELGALNAETAHSGTNVDNAMRQAVKQLIRPNKYGKTLAEQHGFSDDEIGLMNDVAKGTLTRNTLRYVGNLFGGGGGFGQLGMTAAGMGLGYETGRPEFLALPALGAAARYGAGRLAQSDAQRLLGQVARRSPLGSVPPTVAPSQAQALLGAGALRSTSPLAGTSLPGLPALSGPAIGRAQDQGNVPGPEQQQQAGGRVQQQRATGGKVGGDSEHKGPLESKGDDKSSAEKATKTQADYRGGNDQKHCAICTMFQPPHGCSSVRGQISPRGLCNYFEAKRQERANGGRVNASNIEHQPSEAQKEAGNYAKDHVCVHGLDITIENAKGHHRRGVGRDGKPWSVKMPAHYGYIKGTVGKDKDHVDVYLGPHLKAPNVWVLDQMNAESKQFDEHKTFVGFASKDQVVETYRKAFSDGKAMERLGHLTRMTVPTFKQWLESGNMGKTANDHFADAVKIDATHDGPWMSCMSIDGKTMYRNRNIPATANIKGKTVDVNDMLLHHEIPERDDLENLMKEFETRHHRKPNKNEAKAIYLKAHNRSGTPNERAYARKIGVDWKAWSAWCRGEESKIEKGPFTNQPKDADVKPIPHQHGELAAVGSREAA